MTGWLGGARLGRRSRLRPTRLCHRRPLAWLPLCLVLAACGRAEPEPLTGLDPSGRPACDDPAVVEQVLDIANNYPDESRGMPATAVGLTEIEETRAQAIPDIGSGTFQRLCIAQLSLANDEVIEIGYEIFTTDTVLGPAYGLTPCFGPYDQAGRDCSSFRDGRIPGEAP